MISEHTIHRLWMGPRPMPVQYNEYAFKWEELNPGWHCIDWHLNSFAPRHNLDIIDDLFHRDNYRHGVELFVQLADLLSYEILWRFGGVYVNVDIEPVRSLEHLTQRYEVEGRSWAPMEDGSKLVNCAMGAPEREHEFWGACMEHVAKLYWSQPGAPMTETTGPRALTETVFQGGHEFCVLPRASFNPTHWLEIEAGGDATGKYDWENDPRVIGVHHWGHKLTGRTNYVEDATQA